MLTKTQFILLSVVFGIGFATGLYVSLSLPAKAGVTDISSIILAVFGGIGLMVTLSRWIIDWYNQPTLEIVGLIKFTQWVPYGHTWENYLLEHYCIRIKNTKRKGMAEACRANLVIPNATFLGNVPTYWRHTNRSTTVDISTIQDLRLFTVASPFDKIFFPMGHVRKEDLTPEGENERSYSEFIQKELEVHFGSKSGRFLQNTYRKKIQDIINESKME